MLTALFLGTIGTALSLYIGQTQLNWEITLVFKAIASSNFWGFTALMSVLWLQRVEKVRALFMPNVPASWVWLVGIYFGGMLLVIEELRDLRALGLLSLPLVFSTGFVILAFGPLQDRLVGAMQRKERAKKIAAAHDSWNSRAEIVGESHE